MWEKIKNCCKKWWFWILIISIIYGIYNELVNKNEVNTTSESNVIESSIKAEQSEKKQQNIEEVDETRYIYSDEFDEYINKKTKELISVSYIFSTYSISSIGNSAYSIYCYTNRYYDLVSFSNSAKNFIKDFVISISEKDYKPKYFAPKEVIISIEFCGYGKNLNTQEIEHSLHPLADFSIKTNELKTTEDIFSKLKIYDYWF